MLLNDERETRTMTPGKLNHLYMLWTKGRSIGAITKSFVDFVEENSSLVIPDKEEFSFAPSLAQYRMLTSYCTFCDDDYYY